MLSPKWTSSKYQSMIRSIATFQNLLYQINFNVKEQSVVPVLDVTPKSALIGQSIFLNAANSYIAGVKSNDKFKNLTFEWICVAPFVSHCTNKTSSNLTISESTFKDVGAKYLTNYMMRVIITWTRSNKTTKYHA